MLTVLFCVCLCSLSIPNTLEPMLMSNVLKKRKLKMKKHKHKKRRKLTRALRKALKK